MKTVVTKRRSLTPIAGMPPVAPGAHAMRRGTAQKEMTERVTLRASGGAIYEGWALNGSSGGLRAILDLDAKDVKDVKELKAEGALVGAKPKRVSLGSDVQV